MNPLASPASLRNWYSKPDRLLYERPCQGRAESVRERTCPYGSGVAHSVTTVALFGINAVMYLGRVDLRDCWVPCSPNFATMDVSTWANKGREARKEKYFLNFWAQIRTPGAPNVTNANTAEYTQAMVVESGAVRAMVRTRRLAVSTRRMPRGTLYLQLCEWEEWSEHEGPEPGAGAAVSETAQRIE